MELFLLIAIGITIISFISIVLTKPSQASLQELIPEPTQVEFIMENDANPSDSSIEQNDNDLAIEAEELAEEKVIII